MSLFGGTAGFNTDIYNVNQVQIRLTKNLEHLHYLMLEGV